ncbi:MAG: hypothetical protein ACD_68C00120G0003 [uncultured bacterium]|nr:MAG: hypothetical protein ACD_68C00120G0003 [uncultured bacterium]
MNRIKPIKNNQKRAKKYLKITTAVLAIVILIFVVIGVIAYQPAKSAYQKAFSGKDKILRAQELVITQDLDNAGKELAGANQDFKTARDEIAKVSWLKMIPFVGSQIKAAENMVLAAEEMTSALTEVVDVVEIIIVPFKADENRSFHDFTVAEKEQVLQALYESTPQLQRAVSKIELAKTKIDSISDFMLLPQLREAIDLITGKLPDLQNGLKIFADASQILPPLSGYPNERTYLFLFKNNTELRPDGGFNGSYGELKMKDAEITSFHTDDTYNLDESTDIKVTPPWQIKTLINPYLTTWALRDANWSPDFGESSKKAEWFYEQEGGTSKFSGTIALTPTAIENFLEFTGPLSINGYTFDKENFTEQLEFIVEREYKLTGTDREQRKDIIAPLAEKIIDTLFSLPKEKWIDFAEVVVKTLREKQLMVYLHNEEEQEFITKNNWGGIVDQSEKGDYLMVVDANMASLKTNALVERTINYDLDLTQSKPKATVMINYRNDAALTWKTTRYRTWTRLYAPVNSVLGEVSGNETDLQYYNSDNPYEVTEELNKASFGTFLIVNTESTADLSYSYELPSWIKENMEKGEYQLLVQKQPGTIEPGLNIKITFPKVVKSWSGEGGGLDDSQKILTFNTNLRTDKSFSASF